MIISGLEGYGLNTYPQDNTKSNKKNSASEVVSEEDMLSQLSERGKTTERQSIDGTCVQEKAAEKSKAPYSYLATDGIIEYNGVTFVCDEERNRLCLGDVSNSKDCITIPLSEGGSLVVNRDSLGALSSAITMFSPEDIKRILWAIAQDKKVQEMQNEIDEDKNSIGNGTTNTAKGGKEASSTITSMDVEADSITEEQLQQLFVNHDEKE